MSFRCLCCPRSPNYFRRYNRDPPANAWRNRKVSRERVGSEVDQMVRSAASVRAFELMEAMRLLPLVFNLPDDAALEDAFLKRGGDRTRIYEYGMVYVKVRGG